MTGQSTMDKTQGQAAGQPSAPAHVAERDRQLFDRISADYCAKDLAASSRHARRQRLLRTLEGLSIGMDMSVLEIGCGAGFSVQYLPVRPGRFVGLDHSEQLIECARAHNGGPGVQFEVADVTTFRAQAAFDVAIAIGVLHHVAHPAEAVRAAAAMLRPGGWFAVNEPNRGNLLIGLGRRVRARYDSSYSRDQIQFSARELVALFSAAGFTNIRVRPQGFLSTPFAEVIVKPQALAVPLSRLAVFVDRVVERIGGQTLVPVSWNIVVAGRKPPAGGAEAGQLHGS